MCSKFSSVIALTVINKLNAIRVSRDSHVKYKLTGNSAHCIYWQASVQCANVYTLSGHTVFDGACSETGRDVASK